MSWSGRCTFLWANYTCYISRPITIVVTFLLRPPSSSLLDGKKSEFTREGLKRLEKRKNSSIVGGSEEATKVYTMGREGSELLLMKFGEVIMIIEQLQEGPFLSLPTVRFLV